GDEGVVTIESVERFPDNTHLLGEFLGKYYCEGNLKTISTVTAGSGAENTLMGCLNFSFYDTVRKTFRYKQAGRGGTGTVFRDKNIKAIVVKFSNITTDINNPADLDRAKKVGREYIKEIKELDPKQNEIYRVGTSYIVTIMNEFDLLPVNNFKFGNHPEAENLGKEVYRKKFHKGYDGCWIGCPMYYFCRLIRIFFIIYHKHTSFIFYFFKSILEFPIIFIGHIYVLFLLKRFDEF
ncbi:unnamed protein product, partial [marine sediment metagenome]